MTDDNKKVLRGRARARWIVFAALGAMSLAVSGCSTNGNIFESLGTGTTTPAASVNKPTRKAIAFAPLVGAPANISQQLSTSVASAVQKQNVPVVTGAGVKSDYTVRGYVVAAPDTAGTKLSYIWDVTDQTGKRAHRITGEEFVQGKTGSDPWANVSPSVIDGIANKTATQLAAWVPPANGTGGAVGIGGPQPSNSGTSPVPLSTSTNGAQPALSPTQQVTRTASAPLPVLAMVPPVTGAPGDGQRSLAEALKRSLSSRGIPLTTKASKQTYTVKGNVALGQPVNGAQDIKIEWLVLDPKGQRVGTVAQKNKIPQGSLDGAWGRTADAAALKAAEGVAELLPKTVRVN